MSHKRIDMLLRSQLGSACLVNTPLNGFFDITLKSDLKGIIFTLFGYDQTGVG